MTRAPLTEDRLRAALHATADGVEPDDDTAALATIRRRGRTAIVRRRAVLGGALAAAVVGVVAIVVPQLGDETSRVDVITPPDETTVTEPEPAPTTTVTPTPPVEQTYLWPPPGHPTYTDPVEAARSFVAEYVGISDPPLGDVVEEEPRRVQVPVFTRGEDGSVREDITRSTIHLFQVEDDTWRVTLAQSESIVVDSVQVAQSAAAITVNGRGRGFEGTIIGEARAADGSPIVDQEIATAGCCETLEPFEITFTLPRPPAPTDSVLLYNDAGFEGAVPDFTVVPAVTTTATGTTVDVYLVGPGGDIVPVTRSVTGRAVLNGALRSLLEGPTPEEAAQGYTSAIPILPEVPPALLATATITDGVAHVDMPINFAQEPASPGQTLPPERAAQVVEQLWRTAFQFLNISQVEFTLSGSCEDFGLWTGDRGVCRFDRALLESEN
jgi:hypothetical protein